MTTELTQHPSFRAEILGNALSDYKIFEDKADTARLDYHKKTNLERAIRILENYKRIQLPQHYNVFVEFIIDPEIERLQSKLNALIEEHESAA